MINTTFEYNSLTLNDQSNEWLSGVRDNIDWAYVLTNISGLDDPAFRDSRQNRASMDGQIDYGHFLSERLITLEGKIIAKSESDLVIKRQNLENAFIKDGSYNWLQYQLSGQVAKQAYCKVFSKNITETYIEKYIRPFLVNLIAVDPRIYSQTEHTETVHIPTSEGGFEFPMAFPLAFGVVQIGGKIIITNDGNYPSHPVLKMHGPLNIPKIKNWNDDAKEIQINLVVADGSYLEIDFEDKTIMLSGTASRYHYLDTDSEWWEIKPNSNLLEFRDSGGDTDGYCEITFRHSWI